MLFKPKWVKELPNYMRPNDDQIVKLEKVRSQFNIPHEFFLMRVASSPAITRKVQRYILEESCRNAPDASEKELWIMVLMSRMDTYKNKILNDVSTGVISQSSAEKNFDKMMKIIEQYEEIVKRIKSFEELCDYIISLDEMFMEESYSSADPYGIGNMIDKILKE